MTKIRVAELDSSRGPRLASHAGVERSAPAPADSQATATLVIGGGRLGAREVAASSRPPIEEPRPSLAPVDDLEVREDARLDPPLPSHFSSHFPGQVPANRDLSGTLLLDRYRLLKKLGEGGMGTVYLAEHVTIKKRCAIKLLNPEYAHKADLVERFLQEARAASMISHENVVEITDFGAAHGSVFFVMEMLIGEDLADTIRREAPLPWSRVAPIALQICRALAAAHSKGIVHRDMKPENCFRIERHDNADFIKVLDFGIAKVTSDDPEGTGARLTSTGMIFGTPTYMSPEQAQGERVDSRADIYALGVILYELLTGKVPFSADNFMGILTKHMFDEPMAPSEAAPYAEVSPEAEAIVLKALQKDRAYRFQTMEEFAAAIVSVGTGAEPVTLVPEARARPISEGRPTAFLIRANSGAMPRSADEVTLPPQRRRGMMAAVAIGFAVLGGSAASLFVLNRPSTEAPTELAARTPAARETPTVPVAVPVAVPVVPVLNPEPALEPVRVYVTSNVPAEVVDREDDTVLGVTGEAGFTVPQDGGPRLVLVRAPGHEELALTIDPAEGPQFTANLKKRKLAGKHGKPGEPGGAKKHAEPTGDPRPNDTKQGSMGLKNPFQTREP